MRLNHLNLTVADVNEARKFLEKYFQLHTRASRGESFAVLSDEDGFVLTLMKSNAVNYPKTFHIGFVQENEEQVNLINQRLRDDGFEVGSPKRAHGWTFYVNAPGGFTIEVLCPAEKKDNSYL
ncbi:Catechol 2,3-dioxygenase [Fictibacillus solisalsi]|uniref:Catechol 2,3-dioxygenase n=1 Tax=Fictibacillus solisalsi TaxID=459525 RepID=A0A1G9VME9_9BACL|nr:VOC family protein [Fictibacillus solisalsi]SDM73280.1 Catechol 2,3-dioxygenase [Fictibacillus solisalsi]